MTATIVGLTLLVPGPHTHQRRYEGGRPYWHCSTANGPCQGHATVAAAPNSPQTGGRWCPKGLHQGEMRPRSDKAGSTCRGCEADRARAGRIAAGPCPLGHVDTYLRVQPADGQPRVICRACRRKRKRDARGLERAA